MKFICPKCKLELKTEYNNLLCLKCGFKLENKNGIFVDERVAEEKDKEFYDNLYEDELGRKWKKGLNRKNFLKKILEKISLSYRRERFFKRNIKGKDNLILDLACGVGRDYFSNYGQVVGMDLSYSALIEANKKYDFVIQSGVEKLPFEDNTFDYVVSSDFFGHVRNHDKNKIIKEVSRVLKTNGKTVHIIETDSMNLWFQIAHKNPKLFQKYFVEEIGGHVGLELPVDCVKRWEDNGFWVAKKQKIWGTIWPIKDYLTLFDNEYIKENKKLKIIVYISKAFSKYKITEVLINIVLNPVNSIFNGLTNLNNGQGLMLICKKK